MKKYIKMILIFSFFLIFSPINALAVVELPWSTTFDCAEWVETSGASWPPGCSGIEAGSWGSYFANQITTAANYSNGAGGRGMRFWMGDGANVGGTAAILNFGNQKEVWIRWYMRYEPGFAWNTYHYDKLIYLRHGGTPIGGLSSTSIHALALWSNWPSAAWRADVGFQEIWGGGNATSDGSWHCIEVHVKMDTNQNDGVAQLWVDGVLKVSENTISWSGGDPAIQRDGFTGFVFDSNQAYPANGRNAYVDWDDMAVSNTGYIGPLVGGDSAAKPSPPRDFK